MTLVTLIVALLLDRARPLPDASALLEWFHRYADRLGHDLNAGKPVHGTVTQVSADRLVAPNDPRGHYTILLELNDEWKEIPGVVLVPGMPVMVTVPTQERTALQYLVGPMIEYFNGAMRER